MKEEKTSPGQCELKTSNPDSSLKDNWKLVGWGRLGLLRDKEKYRQSIQQGGCQRRLEEMSASPVNTE